MIQETINKPVHPWLRTIKVAYLPGPEGDEMEEFVGELLDHFKQRGHTVQQVPDDDTDVILTSAPFDRPINWREAPLFAARRQFKLSHNPTVYTIVHATRAQLDRLLARFTEILKKDPPDPADYDFPGLSPTGYHVLFEQGHRGGPIMAVERLLQSYTKSIRVLLLVGGQNPESVYHFDLVGAFPESKWSEGRDAFYDDIVMRITTTMSTREVTDHELITPPIGRQEWLSLTTPYAMTVAGQELGTRDFFTQMVIIANLVNVPAISGSVASQYSEGCFSTWDPKINGLVATVTGSSRPVEKTNITEDDLTVIVGVRAGGTGAQVRHVEGKRNDPPSTEAVEMMDMDEFLPQITLGAEWGADKGARVPVVRSKLHGHRGIAAFDPKLVEYVPLDPAYYYYPVSCATEAQARGIKGAFSRAESLLNPDDPRQVAFTVLPGHGVVMGEKWQAGKVPFQVIWEFMDQGALRVSAPIPQGVIEYETGADGISRLKE